MKTIFKNIIHLALLAATFVSAQVFAQQSPVLSFSSGTAQVPLLELFTSEGCSSCPPADRWLSSLRDHPRLWKNFVPLAFHVDYWNYIGWDDPFASKANSTRQRAYAAQYNEPTVYTPGVRYAGREWRDWRQAAMPVQPSNINIGLLTLEITNHQYIARFEASADGRLAISKTSPLQLNIALLGCNLSSTVTRGENRGKTLEHDFVVLASNRISNSASSSEFDQWMGRLPQSEIAAPRLAVVAWITQGDNLTPVQAVGGYLN